MFRARLAALLAMVVAATAAFVVGLVTPAAAAVTDGAVFNNPAVASERYRVRDHVRSLIQGTPAGATIRVAMYHFTDVLVADDLIAAKNRGVNVRLVIDYLYSTDTAVQNLIANLGTSRSNPSWVVLCTPNAACIGSAGTPIMHNKFFLFSSTNGSSNVVLQSSANLTTSNATVYYNNAVTLVGNTGLYNAYVTYHSDLAAKVKDSDYYTTVSTGNAKVYFFPRAGSDSTTDTIVNALDDNVTCEGNTSTGTATGRTIIRVGMWYFSRDGIARSLRALADQNCWIEVVYTTMDSGVMGYLSGHDRIVLYHMPDPWVIHSKYMLIEGTYAGLRDTKWVFTGSHNYSNAALRENDETLLRIQSNTIHDQYRSNFWTVRAASVRQ